MLNFEGPPALQKGQDINRNQCKICNRKFVNKVGLDTHTRQVHHVENNKIEERQIVISKDPRNGEKKRVDQNGKPYTCEKCLADFRLKDDLYKHVKTAHGVILEKNQKCFICDHVTTGPKLLELHIAKVHEGKTLFSCDKCDKGYSTASKLKEHVQCIHEGRKHLCDTCGKGYIHKKALTDHINVIHNKFKRKTHLCSICGKDYNIKWALEQHMASIHNEGILDKKYKCDICDYASVMR